MCNHSWEKISDIADGTGDRYIEEVCQHCGESKETIIDDTGR